MEAAQRLLSASFACKTCHDMDVAESGTERKVNMKKNRIFAFAIVAMLSATIFSCSTLKELGLAPSISVKDVKISSLDFEGITFDMGYSVTNPLPLGFSIKKLSADVLCESQKFTSLSADEGVKVLAGGTKSNKLSFKVPYETILSFAKKSGGSDKKAIPFKIDGNLDLDLSAIPMAQEFASNLPFSLDFDVPVFKPSFSVSNPRVQLPSLASLKDAFVSGGMNVLKAATLASSIIAGKSVAENAFDGVNLDFVVNFDLNVANSGSAPWKYVLQNCSLKTGYADAIKLSAQNGTITSSSGTIPISARLNTLTAGKFIAQILNKKGAKPVFSFDSSLSFTELSYAPNIPLAYSKEIPIGNFGVKK